MTGINTRPNSIVFYSETHTKSNKILMSEQFEHLTVCHSQRGRADGFSIFVHSTAFVCVCLCSGHSVNLEVRDVQSYPVEAVSSTWLLLFCPPTCSMYSPVDLLYLLWNLFLSESVPLVRLHDTSGFGVPVTLALNTAIFPAERWEIFCFQFCFFFNTNCINISALEICCGEAHLVIYLLVPVYSESLECLFPLACLSHTA